MLDIQHLSFAVTNEAAGKEILHDITLTVDSGRFVVITGPNGGGQSELPVSRSRQQAKFCSTART